MRDFLLNIIISLPAIIIGFTIHEYAHARTAYKLGDMTPKFQGRVTLNPSSHIDPLGMLAIVVFGFGWGKAVQTNPSAYKNYYKDDLKVSLAGPLSNLGIAVVGAVLLVLYSMFIMPRAMGATSIVGLNMLLALVTINVNLFLLNMIPLPGFDGFSIIRDLAPAKFYKWAEPLYQYQMLIMVGIVVLGRYVIGIPSSLISSTIISAVQFIFGIF